jgi:hypothetical protein
MFNVWIFFLGYNNFDCGLPKKINVHILVECDEIMNLTAFDVKSQGVHF